MPFRVRNVPVPMLVVLILSAVVGVAALMGSLAQIRISAQEKTVQSLNFSALPSDLCKVQVEGDFLYQEAQEYDVSPSYLVATIRLTNQTGMTFLPGGAFKLGLRWMDRAEQRPQRLDQYRIEIPNELRPHERLDFSTRIPLLKWDDPREVLLIEFMNNNEGGFWCADHGVRPLTLFRVDLNEITDARPGNTVRQKQPKEEASPGLSGN